MAKNNKKKKSREPGRDLATLDAPPGVPNYLAAYVEEDKSLEDMKAYRVLQRLKVIQSTSNTELLDKFEPGDIILSPGQALIAAVDRKSRQSKEPFLFVPVFFFAEFCKWSDLDDKESATILGRSFDPTNEIAKRARDPKRRFEKYNDGNYVARYVEHLNFAGFIYGEHEFAREACVQTFSRGEFGRGRNFISAITLRKAIPLWAQIWQFTVGFRDPTEKRKWWGMDFIAPEGENVIGEDEVEFHKAGHEELKDLYEKQRLIVDHEDSGKEDGAEDGNDDF